MRSCIVLLFPTIAHAGATQSTLDAPTRVFTGVPATFSVSSPSPTGVVGLLASATPLPLAPGAPVACPAPLDGDCLDLADGAVLIAGGRLRATGTTPLTATPPWTTPAGLYTVQAATRDGLGNVSTTQPVAVEVVDSCASLTAISPSDGTVLVDPESLVRLDFDSPTAGMWDIRLLDDVGDVAQTTFIAGNTAFSSALLVPDTALDYATVYTVSATSPCGTTTTSTFATPQGPLDLGDFAGRAFTFDASAATYTGILASPSIDPSTFSTFVTQIGYELRASTLGADVDIAVQTHVGGDPLQQVPCGPWNTYDVVRQSDTSVTIIDDDWSGDISGTPIDGAVHIAMTFAQGSNAPVDASFAISVRDPAGTACAQAQAECGPCLDDPTDLCILMGIEDLTGVEIPQGLVAPGPSCPS